ncbi:MAG: glutamine--fructose-6-phosphate transaminase (isomerizing) [Pontiellaceae bacterium]
MCGIIGFFGKQPATNIILDGLKRMEYRGYDSAGIACLSNQSIGVIKQSGKIKELREKVDQKFPEKFLKSNYGIGHTRWATHGKPSNINAHPHLDISNSFAMVHNGIIENYKEIRNFLNQQDINCISDTDSEVLIQLIAYCFNGNLEEAVSEALKKVVGTYGILVISYLDPDKIVAARCGSPIVIGLGKNEIIIASDAEAIRPHTRDVMYLEDYDLAVIKEDSVNLLDIQHLPVNREITAMDWEHENADKGSYDHFMLKEIFEQPTSLRNTIRGRLNFDSGTAVLSGLDFSVNDSISIKRILIIGCGTSMHAGMVGEYAFEDIAGIPVKVEQAAEFRYRNPIINKNDLVIAISQSGETADTLAAVKEAKKKGVTVVSICNVVSSAIARETGRGVYLHAGPEIGVASTKAFTCQVVILLMMALKVSRTRTLPLYDGEQIAIWLDNIPNLAEKILKQNDLIKAIAKKIMKEDHAFFIGRGFLYPVALEGALKLKEISYVHAEGYHASELKHGPIALLEEGTPVIALLNDIPGKDKTYGNAQECKSRGANVIAVITEGDEEIAEEFTDKITIPKCPAMIATIPTTIALQLLAYHIAVLRGCDVDQPRNLAKSVTVE